MKVHDLAVCSSRGQCSGVWQVRVSPSKQILPFYHPGLVCSGSSEGHAGSQQHCPSPPMQDHCMQHGLQGRSSITPDFSSFKILPF